MKKIAFPEHHLLQMLRQYENNRLPLDLFLNHYFRTNRALGSKDRQFIAQAAYNMLRWRSLLDYLIGSNPSWEKRYEQFCDFKPLALLYDASIPLSTRLSFPQELLSKLIEEYGETKAIELCLACNSEAPISIRVNPLKTTRDELLAKWESFDAKTCPNSPLGIQFKTRISLVCLPEFKQGYFEIQDEASQLVAALVQPNEGSQVLDYCAGSGGKTLAFAYQMKNKGQIYLHDIRPHVLEQAKKRLKRAGIQNAQLLAPGHKKLTTLHKKMDWVMLDVPCSGTGTLRRNPDQKWKFSTEVVKRLVAEQREIFEKGICYLKPGGKIVYATCSILEDENRKQVEHFINNFPVTLDSAPFTSFPSLGGMDGFFAAVFIGR